MKRLPLLLSAGLFLLTGDAATAGLVFVEGTFTVIEGVRQEVLGQLLPGDTFGFSFSYEDSVTDSDAAVELGTFTDVVVTGGTFQRISGSGLWNPGGGHLGAGTIRTSNDLPGLFGTPGISDGLSIYNQTLGFAPVGDLTFVQLYLPLLSPDLLTVLDTGAGQTLVQQLHGLRLNGRPWVSGPGSLDFLRTAGGPPGLFQAAPGTILLTLIVPEPSVSLLVIPCMAAALRRRRP